MCLSVVSVGYNIIMEYNPALFIDMLQLLLLLYLVIGGGDVVFSDHQIILIWCCGTSVGQGGFTDFTSHCIHSQSFAKNITDFFNRQLSV